jgi:hypothetical protein
MILSFKTEIFFASSELLSKAILHCASILAGDILAKLVLIKHK